jgi:hypothetical protein
MHPAYGRTGDVSVGGLEVIGYDRETDQFKCYCFDGFGNLTPHTVPHIDGVRIWQSAHTRAAPVASQMEGHWTPAMNDLMTA